MLFAPLFHQTFVHQHDFGKEIFDAWVVPVGLVDIILIAGFQAAAKRLRDVLADFIDEDLAVVASSEYKLAIDGLLN